MLVAIVVASSSRIATVVLAVVAAVVDFGFSSSKLRSHADAAVASMTSRELRQQRFDATIAELERQLKEIQKKNNVSHVLSVLGRHAQDEEIAVCARGSAKIADDQ